MRNDHSVVDLRIQCEGVCLDSCATVKDIEGVSAGPH
jgi:hypothetical protein